ncbi:MAG: PP2C family protein-serine/threonine phosphatase [Bacteroidota bacterium]
MAQFPHNGWKTMNIKDHHQFAVAVFFLFAAIGPLTLLMESTIIQASWIRLIVMTILCGLFSWSIVMSFNKPLRLISAVIVYVAIILSMSFIDPVFLQPDVDTVDVKAGTPFQLSKEQLSDIETKRTLFGVVAVFCISIGYALFVRALAKEHKRRAEIEAEVKLAQTIHESLLPKSPLTTSWCDIAGTSVPATQIGGDFYDIIKISDSKILVVIADASGHGTGAGILSAMTKSGIIQELRHTHSPAELLKNVNTTIHSVTKKNMFVTCALALFDHETKLVSMVTAGHPPILHYDLLNDTIEEYRMHNLALGISPAVVFESKSIPFRTNDIFCFITDGLTETSNAKNQQFGMDRVKSLIRNTPDRSAEAINSAMIASVQQFSDGRELSDDITTVISRIQ